jgi:hypothetical protein
MNAYNQITVEAAHSQGQVDNHQCVVVETCDTIKEAKSRAKYVLTADFACSAELSCPLKYARIMADGQCLYDYFSRT